MRVFSIPVEKPQFPMEKLSVLALCGIFRKKTLFGQKVPLHFLNYLTSKNIFRTWRVSSEHLSFLTLRDFSGKKKFKIIFWSIRNDESFCGKDFQLFSALYNFSSKTFPFGQTFSFPFHFYVFGVKKNCFASIKLLFAF